MNLKFGPTRRCRDAFISFKKYIKFLLLKKKYEIKSVQV